MPGVDSEMRARFAKDVAAHRLTVLRDEGRYRHLYFSNGSGFDWFEVVSWPGTLAVNGDHGSYAFSRVPDMFQFFREPEPNYYYWTQKCVSADRSSGLRAYSPRLFEGAVMRLLAEHYELDDPSRIPAGIADRYRRRARRWADQGRDVAVRLAVEHRSADGSRPFEQIYECTLEELTCGARWCLWAAWWAVREYDRRATALHG